MAEPPKLYVNKPKKAQLKQIQQQQASSPTPTPAPPSSMASSSMARGAAPPPQPPKASSSMARGAAPPPQPPKESFIRRYKYLWPMLLVVNFSIGAYLFMRTKKKDMGTEEGEIDVPGASISTVAASTVSEKEKEVAATPTLQPMIVQEPIPENQQRELFKWMLEEKRRIKPKDQEEKKRIDEEKAILKHFIRAKSIPVL